MSRWKTTLVLLIAAIGIGFYISLYEIRQPTPEEQERHSKTVLSIDPEHVTRLALELPQAKLTLAREGDSWRIQPQQWRADETVLHKLLSQFDYVEATRALDNTPQTPLDLAAFGLQPPVGRITLETAETATTLLVGSPTPVGGNRYVQIEGKLPVYVVAAAFLTDADVPVDTFRDRRLLAVSSGLIQGLEIAGIQAPVALEQRGEAWHLTQPLTDRADRAEVAALLQRLSAIRIERFVEETPSPKRLAAAGLDAPTSRVVIRLKDQPEQPLTLLFGRPMEEDAALVYAARSDESSLYAVAADHLASLVRDVQSLRSKACFEFFSGMVQKVEMTNGSAGWTIERVEGSWRVAGTEEALDTTKMERYLDTLADLRVGGFLEEAPADLAPYGLAGTPPSIAVWVAEQEAGQRLLIGSPIASSANRYGRIDGRQAIVHLPELITKILATTLDDLSTSPPAPSDATPASATPPD